MNSSSITEPKTLISRRISFILKDVCPTITICDVHFRGEVLARNRNGKQWLELKTEE
jgi:hypothetical protein